MILLNLRIKSCDVKSRVAHTFACFQIVGVLVDWACNLGNVSLHTNQAPCEHLQLLMWARVLCRIPFVCGIMVKDCQLGIAYLRCKSTILLIRRAWAYVHPMPGLICFVFSDLCWADDRRKVFHFDLALLATLLPLKISELLVINVCKLAELGSKLGCINYLLPLSLICFYLRLHPCIQLFAQAKRVLHHYFTQMINATLQILQPLRGACQWS